LNQFVIFDLDGTLVDSCDTCIAILTEMLDERGSDHTIDPAVARPFMSRGGVDMISALLGRFCGDPETELADFRSRYQDRVTPNSALFAGVEDSLAKLRDSGFLLAICSNKPQNLCEKVLRDTGIAYLFHTIVGRRPDLPPKPAPHLLTEVLSQLEAEPQNCIFVGDSEIDHLTALSAGIPFLFMTYGYAEEGWWPDDCEIYASFPAMTARIIGHRRDVRSAA
jgi:phosphoglycolate phosphatase